MKETKNELLGNLTPEQLKAMKKEISESLSRDRHKLLVDLPFLGNIAMRFDLIPVRDKRCRTACTDYRNIYFDCDFYSKLTPEERVFVMGHEVWHAVQIHACRRQTRDPVLWNIAADMEINNILADGSSGKSYAPPKHLMFPPAKLKGQSAETLYDWLLKQAEKNNLNNALSKMGQPQQSSGWCNSGSSSDDDDDKSGNGKKKQQQQQNGQGEREKRDGSKDGKNTGKLEGQFDKHCYEGDGDDEDENGNKQIGQKGKDKDGKGNGVSKNGNPTDQWGEVGYDDDFRPRVGQDAAERMREAAISAAQAYQREHGNLPAGVEGLIGKLTKPQLDWKQELAKHVSQCYGGKRQWLPPNRRHVYNDMYFQSRRNETVNIGVFIDTSGSTTGDLPQFFGELKGLVESFGSYTIHLIQCDAAVDKYVKYEANDNPLDLDEAGAIEYSGGGGTSFDPPFKFIEEESINIDAAIYMTDGYGPCTVEEPPYPVLWLITPGGTMDFVDWGRKVMCKGPSWD